MACLKRLRTDLNPTADPGGVWKWNITQGATVIVDGLTDTLTNGSVIGDNATPPDDPEVDFHSWSLGPGTYPNAIRYEGGSGACAGVVYFTLVISAPPNAGSDSSVTLCTNDSPILIFDQLGGTPDTDGEPWSGTGTSSGGYIAGASPQESQFNPGVDGPGTYVFTYTVNDDVGFCPCDPATATVTITVLASFDPGTGGTIETCAG